MATTPAPQSPSEQDRHARIRASLAERSGSIEDSLDQTGHEPDQIDATGIGHCRVVVPDAWTPPERAA